MRRTQPGSAIKLINNDGTKSFIILEWNVYGHPLERMIKLVLCKANFWHKNIDHTAGGAGTGEWLLKGKGYFLRCEVKFEAYTHFDKEAAWNTTSSSLKYSPGEDLVRVLPNASVVVDEGYTAPCELSPSWLTKRILYRDQSIGGQLNRQAHQHQNPMSLIMSRCWCF